MPRASTTADVFNAIAEPKRRAIIDALRGGRRTVTELIDELRYPQPAMSKHLGVLRKVGIVSVTRVGQHRLYQLNAQALQPVHEWVRTYERFWTHQIDRVKERAERKAAERRSGPAAKDPPSQNVGDNSWENE